MTFSRPDDATHRPPREIERVVREHAHRARLQGEGPERMIVSLKQAMREVIDPHDAIFPRADEEILRWAIDEYYGIQPANSRENVSA